MSNIPTGKKIYLCTPDLKPITVLNGIDTESVNYSEHLRDYSSLTFDVYENIVVDGRQIKSNGYDELDVYMNLYLEDIAYFQMQYPQVQNDGIKEYKSITAYSIDKEWEDKDWVNFKVNTGEKDSLEQLVEDNTDDLGFTINFIDFFNPDREDLSLLNIIINEKMPTWSVDASDIDRVLWNKKLSISEDSINLYALLTSVIAPNAECIFEFDCLNRKLKAHYKDNLEYDTNIFIGFRNLASQIEQSVDEDSVFTRFNVEGGNNLTIQEWNYNNSRIFNLDYFMHEPYMSQEQIDRFKAWIKWQDDNREQFANLSQQVSDYEAKIYTLKYMLPDDGTEIAQWKNMNREGLEESLKYYNSLLDAFEVSVDENPTYTGSDGKTYHRNDEGKIVDEDGVIVQSGVKLTYNPWKIDDQGEQVVDYDRYLQLLYQMENGKSGYYTYYEIVTYIIPNIEIALHNLDVPTEDDEEEYNEDFETNWELYGSVELEGKLEDYENRLEVLKEFAEDDPDYDEEGQRLHEEYVQIVELVGDEETEDSLKWWLKKRRDEIEEIGAQEKPINLQRMQMVAKVSMYETEILESDENEYGYDVVELDEPNSEWGFTKKDLLLFHTLMHDTDYTNENILTTSLNTTSTVTSTETIIQKEKELLDDSLDKLSEISQPQITFSVSMDNIMNIPEFEGLRDDCRLLRFIRLGVRDDYSVKLRIVGRSWNPCEVGDDFSLEFSNMVTSRSGRSDLTDLLNNGGGNATKNSITIGSGNSDSDKEYAANLLSLMVNSGLFGSAVAGVGGTGVDEAAVNELIENYLYSNVINEASFNRIFSRYIDVEKLVADSIDTETLVADIIRGRDEDSDYYMNLLTGHLNMNTIVGNNVFTNAVTSISSTAATSVINDAYIYDAVAGKITVSDLAAGDIVLSNNMRILSEEDATEGMIMSGSEIQFLDGDGNPSISIGYNTISDGQGGTTVDYDHPAIIIKDANGSVMLNSTGLSPTDVGLAPMIQNSSISKNQLNFPIIEANAQGGIDITQIYDGSGNLWGVQYTSFVNSTNNALDDLDQKIDDSTVSSLTKEYTISIHYDSLENPDWADSTIPEWQTTEPDKEELGADHYLWERDKITLTDGTVIYSNMVCSRSISGVISEVDKANKSITDKVWQTDIESEIDYYDENVVTSIRNRVSKTETDISGITQTVSDQRETVDALGTRVTTAESNIRQNASNISLMVSVDDETSDITINEKMIQAMTNQFIVKSPDGRRTIISGGLLSTDAIQSNNYIAPTGTASSGAGTYPYSSAGSKFDLTNGNIYTPNFMLDSVNGNAYLSGTIETGAGHIGGFTITDTSIYNNMKSFDDEIDLSNYSLDDNFYLEVPSYYMTEDGEIINSFELDEDNYIVGVTPVFYGVYIGTDGIALGRGKFKVDSFGNLFANGATIRGNITATELTITEGAKISGFNVGGRNLLLDSLKDKGKSHTAYGIVDFNLSESLIAGQTYTVSAKVVTSEEKQSISIYHSGGSIQITPFMPIEESSIYKYTFIATSSMESQTSGSGHGYVRVYVSNNEGMQGDTEQTGTANVEWIKLEKGNFETNWSPAPEDLDVHNYITEIDNSGIWVTPANMKPTDSSGTGATGVNITANGMGIYKNGLLLTDYGSTTNFYVPDATNHVVAASLGADGLVVSKGKIGGFDLSATQLNAYGTASGAGTSDNGLYRLLIQSNPGTNGGNNIAFGAASRATTSDSWTWNTYINHNGYLYSKNANIQGTITATEGKIGNFTIGTALYNGISSISATSGTGVYLGTDGINLGGGKFKVTNAGALTSTSGTIGSFTISGTGLRGTEESTGKVIVMKPSGWAFAAGGTTHESYADCPFRVSISGALYSTSGQIGGWTIDGTNGLTRGGITLDSTGLSYQSGDKFITFGKIEGTSSTGTMGVEADETTITIGNAVTWIVLGSDGAWLRPGSNNNTELGHSNYKWEKVWAQNGSIQTSDKKDKDILGELDIETAEQLIFNSKPVEYMWKSGDHRRTRMGFIAQDTAEICKSMNKNLALVTASYKVDFNSKDEKLIETKEYFGEDVDDEQLTWGMSYDELIAPLVKVVQNQHKEIQNLKKRLEELERSI